MPNSIDEKLEKAWDFLNKGKLEEALKLVSEIEEKDDLAPEDKLEILSLKGIIYFFLGKFVELLNIAKYLSKESTRLNKPLYLVESIVLKFGALALMTTDVS
ncbi:MAG: hypothetical protein ACFFFB_23300 [Candidatus Heimdallarchaeota archaeon]